MKTAIAIRHVAFEDLGDFAPILLEHGYAIHILDAGVDALDTQATRQADLLIVLGAPIGAFDEALYPFLHDELSLLQHRLANQQPTLGICLGAQLMARALGAAVAPMGHKEIGYAPLSFIEPHSVLAPLGEIPVLHWHGDQFAIPHGASRLAASALCPNQAFALGHYALGLQCHLEADARQIERWLISHALELQQTGVNPQTIRQHAQVHGDTLHTAASAVLSNWLKNIDLK